MKGRASNICEQALRSLLPHAQRVVKLLIKAFEYYVSDCLMSVLFLCL